MDCENRIDRLRLSSISARDGLENRNLSEGDAKPPLIEISFVCFLLIESVGTIM